MTEHAAHASHHAAKDSGAWVLPATVSVILAIIWGAYTALVVFEIVTSPIPSI